MCGIVGILNLDGSPVEPDCLERMNRTIAHRGPEDAVVLERFQDSDV